MSLSTIRNAVLTFVAGAAFTAFIAVAAKSQQMPPNGRAIFLANCATCHGETGKGDRKPSEIGFDLPMPNFTDCSFATREADGDWSSTIHKGGPRRAFPRNMPAFEDALSDDEIDAVIAYLRTLCTEPGWPRGEFNYPLAMFTEKAFPEDELVSITSFATKGPAAIDSTFIFEKRVGATGQIEVNLPLVYRNGGPGIGKRFGIGDAGIAWKQNILADVDSGTIFSLLGEAVLPTGNEHLGLGTGTMAFETHALFGQDLPDEFILQGDIFGAFPTNTNKAPNEANAHIAIGRTFAEDEGYGRAWTPMVEILAGHAFTRGAGMDWDIVPQMQVSLSQRQHILASAGVRVPLNDTRDRVPEFVFYLIWDWYDAPLLGGWSPR